MNIHDAVLVKLRAFSHGQWAHSNLNRIAFFARNIRGARSPKLHARLQDALSTFRQETLKALGEMTRQNEHFQPTSSSSDRLRELTAHLREGVEALAGGQPLTATELKRLETEIPQTVESVLTVVEEIRQIVFANIKCDPYEAIQRVLEAQKEVLKGAGVTVLFEGAVNRTSVVMKPSELANILNNLVSNSIRAMEMSVEKALTFASSVSQDRWLLEVRDTGCGIPEEEWDVLFQPRPAAEASDDSTLYDMQECLLQYGGDISIKHSVLHAGTVLLIRLLRAKG